MFQFTWPKDWKTVTFCVYSLSKCSTNWKSSNHEYQVIVKSLLTGVWLRYSKYSEVHWRLLPWSVWISSRISSVIELCPNLNVLYISDGTGSLNNERDLFFRVGKNVKSPVFKELSILICVGEIPVEILICLLSCPLLEYVGISRCDSLTDDVILETVKCHHRFRNIRQMQIDHCDYVTERGIDALLINDGNPLEIIDIYKCKNIAIQSFANWRSLIVKNNWNLNINRKS